MIRPSTYLVFGHFHIRFDLMTDLFWSLQKALTETQERDATVWSGVQIHAMWVKSMLCRFAKLVQLMLNWSSLNWPGPGTSRIKFRSIDILSPNCNGQGMEVGPDLSPHRHMHNVKTWAQVLQSFKLWHQPPIWQKIRAGSQRPHIK